MPKSPPDKPQDPRRPITVPIPRGEPTSETNRQTAKRHDKSHIPGLQDAYQAGRRDGAFAALTLLGEIREQINHNPWCRCCDMTAKFLNEQVDGTAE